MRLEKLIEGRVYKFVADEDTMHIFRCYKDKEVINITFGGDGYVSFCFTNRLDMLEDSDFSFDVATGGDLDMFKLIEMLWST